MGVQLARDLVHTVPWKDEDAKKHLGQARDAAHHDRLLRAKLLEEVAEFLEETEGPGQMDEAVDILEVLLTILDRSGMDPDYLDLARRKKKHERGGFALGITFGDVK
jgi:predicted house-cleaning noncanonical NTP pyrophosphatase (MazG superfamily)